ncbi:hypothetical protein GC173_12520 [bacterium]|nr:hypothetical protein [bacterium]
MIWWKLIFALALYVGATAVILREIMVVGAGRREGIEPKPLYRRFRRRAKGVVLLATVASLTAFHHDIAKLLYLMPAEHFKLLGLLLITVIWVLILAGRDLRETTLEAIEQRQAITVETLKEVAEALERRQAGKREAPPPPDSES